MRQSHAAHKNAHAETVESKPSAEGLHQRYVGAAQQRATPPPLEICYRGARLQSPVIEEAPQDQVVRALLAVGAQRKLGAVSSLGKVLQGRLAAHLKGAGVWVFSRVADGITLQPQATACDGWQQEQSTCA